MGQNKKGYYTKIGEKMFDRYLHRSPTAEKVRLLHDNDDYDDEYADIHDVILQLDRQSELGEEQEMLVLAPLDSPFNQGSLFKWLRDDSYWLVIKESKKTISSHFKGKIRECNHQLKWYDDKGKLQTVYSHIINLRGTGIIDSTIQNVVVDLPNIELVAILPKTEATKKLRKNNRFIINEKPWEINSIDDISVPNLLIIRLEEQVKDSSQDNLEKGIVVTPRARETTTPKGQPFIEGDKKITWGETAYYRLIGEDEERVDDADFVVVDEEGLVENYWIAQEQCGIKAKDTNKTGKIKLIASKDDIKEIKEIDIVSLWG